MADWDSDSDHYEELELAREQAKARTLDQMEGDLGWISRKYTRHRVKLGNAYEAMMENTEGKTIPVLPGDRHLFRWWPDWRNPRPMHEGYDIEPPLRLGMTEEQRALHDRKVEEWRVESERLEGDETVRVRRQFLEAETRQATSLGEMQELYDRFNQRKEDWAKRILGKQRGPIELEKAP
jgi:hypothetical protein